MKRDRYEVPVQGVTPEELERMMRASIDAVLALWPPHTCVTLFVTNFGKGGLGYISNAERASMLATVKEWVKRQETLA